MGIFSEKFLFYLFVFLLFVSERVCREERRTFEQNLNQHDSFVMYLSIGINDQFNRIDRKQQNKIKSCSQSIISHVQQNHLHDGRCQ